MDFKKYFQQPYQGGESFLQEVIFPIFGEDAFEDGYNNSLLEQYPELMTIANATGIKSICHMGDIKREFLSINILDITVTNHVQMNRNRVAIQQLVRKIMNTYSSAFMIFHYKNTNNWDWRFTFCSKKGGNEEITDSKRYTFLLGPNQSCRTASNNFTKLLNKHKEGDIDLKDIEAAFDVEALSKEFFDKYKQQYQLFVDYMCNESNDMRPKFIDISFDHSGLADSQIKDREEKPIRDYVKKMLGRIVFLHFLQKKGWMGVPEDKSWGEGDTNFMKHLFEKCTDLQKENFLDQVLEPLFSEALDKDRSDNDSLFNTGVSLDCGSTVKIPYLNGGLFGLDSLDKQYTKFPAKFFENLFEIFHQYNFTIDENDPNDAQVGVDPEMLGRIFENLLEDNKDKGAFYTPKEIVRYMCRQSLISYLQTDINDEKTKSAIESFVKTYDIQSIGGADSDLANSLNQRLKDVKICDPAIGSGAFPMGLLKELFLCRGALENFNDSADIKRHIIQQNIYGVDIEKGAVDIARLRFWLSLIVDEETPHSLPNLDYKIMQGNSLLESYEGIDLSNLTCMSTMQIYEPERDLFGNIIDKQIKITFTNRIDFDLNEALNKFYNSNLKHTERVELKENIYEYVRQQLLYNIDLRTEPYARIINDLSEQSELTNVQAKRLKESKENYDRYIATRKNIEQMPMQNDKLFLWHTWFSDVFNRPNGCNGFDIVIGNPPYISAPVQVKNEILNKQRIALIESKKYNTLYQKWDLYVPFVERGMQLLREKGISSMIIPYPVTNQLYAKLLRKYLLDKCDLLEIVDLNGVKVFNNATVSNCILIVRNCHTLNETRIVKIDELKRISTAFIQMHIDLLKDKENVVWNLTQNKRSNRRHKEMHVLGDYCYISVGMVLNADEKTAKGGFVKDDLISLIKDDIHPREYIEAKDIERYHVKRVRYLEYGTERCPGQLRRPTFPELYDRHKILTNKIGKICAVLDKNNLLCDQTNRILIKWCNLTKIDNKSILSSIKRYCTMERERMEVLSMSISLFFILGLLNSNYIKTLLNDIRGDGNIDLNPEYIRNIPIPFASKQLQKPIIKLVKKVITFKNQNLQINTCKEETEIDCLVYHLYNLTYDDVLIVDPQTPITREKYENN